MPPPDHINTTTLTTDGESNLKLRLAPDVTKGLTRLTAPTFRADVLCEGPNPRLYAFVGNLLLAADDVTTRTASCEADSDVLGLGGRGALLPLSASSLLLRGCNLRNTHCVLGAVIYTGGWVGY